MLPTATSELIGIAEAEGVSFRFPRGNPVSDDEYEASEATVIEFFA